jgi:protease-4
MTEEEQRYFQALAVDVHEQFKDAVARSRKLKKDRIDEYADGRVYTGRQAQALGLVDKLGGLDMAVEDAGRRAGIEGKPRIVEGVPEKSALEEVRDLLQGYAPISLGKGPSRLSRGFLRLEYSIQ